MVTTLSIIHFSWLCASFMDAIMFEKVYGEDMYVVWHGAKAACFLPLYWYLLYLTGAHPAWYVAICITLHIQHEFFYRLFRFWDVYKLDNRYRNLWLEKVIKHWWELL